MLIITPRLQCTCRRTKAFSGIGKLDLASDFLNEAKKLLDLENGRASVTTVQGLTLLFSVSAYMGSDRAGMVSQPQLQTVSRRDFISCIFPAPISKPAFSLYSYPLNSELGIS